MHKKVTHKAYIFYIFQEKKYNLKLQSKKIKFK